MGDKSRLILDGLPPICFGRATTRVKIFADRSYGRQGYGGFCKWCFRAGLLLYPCIPQGIAREYFKLLAAVSTKPFSLSSVCGEVRPGRQQGQFQEGRKRRIKRHLLRPACEGGGSNLYALSKFRANCSCFCFQIAPEIRANLCF